MKTPIIGTPIRQDAASFTIRDGGAIVTYSRKWYSLESPETIKLSGALHAVAVPVRS